MEPLLRTVHVSHKIWKSALHNSRCHLAGDGSFLDARRTWYRLLENLLIHEVNEQSSLPCALEQDSARVLDSVASIHSETAADQLWDLLEAKL